MKKNIGIFLAYSPGQSIQNHGISRLWSFILNEMLQDADTKVTIATPAWFKKDIIEFLRTQRIDTQKVDLISTDGIPCLVRIKSFLFDKKCSKPVSSICHENGHLKKIFYRGRRFVFDLIVSWMFIYSTPKFIMVTGLWCLLAILLSPFLFIAAVFYFSFRMMRKWHSFAKKVFVKIQHKLDNLIQHKHFLKTIHTKLSTVIFEKFAYRTYGRLRDRELTNLTQLINSRSDISAWFIPTLFWPEFKAIKAKKVIAAPDIVFIDFLNSLSDYKEAQLYEKIAQTITEGDHFVCYSEYVKQKHLMRGFAVDPTKISVIPHGAVDLSSLLAQPMKYQSIQILHDYQKRVLTHDVYLSNFNLSDMRFIFYSSQVRPHKNFKNLIRAYEILLRERFVNVKLIITGNIQSDPELYQYILSKRLQFDVISFYDIPSEVLAALNHLAVCAVNPTLFEGGFPFTFTEAYSVGTPSLMSAIPVVLAEVKDENLRKQMLFDPYDVADMVQKMEWAINNRKKLYEMQSSLYEKFKQRNWQLVAKEYINLLTDSAELSHAE